MPNQFLSPEGDLENYFVSESWLIDQYVGDTLWTFGEAGLGGLGNNSTTPNRCTPVTTFAGGTNWKQSSAARGFSTAIKTDGTLWVWGNNFSGNLGINNYSGYKCTPITTFAGGTNWKQISCGNFHASAIKTDGTLWIWGSNSNGTLGVNNGSGRNTPVTTFAGGTDWKQVASGGLHTAAIKTDGTLWVWGRGGQGQIGNNTTTNRSTPVTTFAGGTNWKQVACGYNSTMAIKTDGTLWTWGYNFDGEQGINSTASFTINTPVTTFAGGTNWKQVAGGSQHTAAIKTDGTLWTWGNNYQFAQLGNNNTTNTLTPITTFAGGTNWKQVACFNQSTGAIKSDGTLWMWGRNIYGSLGINVNNDNITSLTPVTTFAGGTNWKSVSPGYVTLAITSGTDPTYFIS